MTPDATAGDGGAVSATLTPDETAILGLLADGQAWPVTEIAARLNRLPYPYGRDANRQESRQARRTWQARNGELYIAEVRLVTLGLVEGPDNGRRITQAGRVALETTGGRGR